MSNQTKTVEERIDELVANLITWETTPFDYSIEITGEEFTQMNLQREKVCLSKRHILKQALLSEIKTAERELIKEILKLPTHPNGYAQERTIKPSDIKRLAEERGITIE